jgi:hypothetical protein
MTEISLSLTVNGSQAVPENPACEAVQQELNRKAAWVALESFSTARLEVSAICGGCALTGNCSLRTATVQSFNAAGEPLREEPVAVSLSDREAIQAIDARRLC